MPTLYITEPGAVVRKSDERIKVTLEKETLLDVPLLRIDDVVALGRVTVTPAAVESILQRKISMAFLTESGRFLGRLEPAFSKNCFLRRAQYEVAFSEERTLTLAKAFVAGKLANQRAYLVRANRSRRADAITRAIAQIKKSEKRLHQADDVEALLGHEGAGSAAYFGVFGSLLQEGCPFSFAKRARRPPTDPINALLSFGYALLANDITGLLSGIGFDPYVGYLHAHAYGRASLALDLMEEFRAVIVDSVVLTSVNKKILGAEEFECQPGGVVRLSDAGRKNFLQQYEQRKRRQVLHPVFGYQASYLRCMELQARLLGKVLQGELDAYLPFKIK